ncbi:DUF3558 domain-containing protein [Actinophytocola sp.]|uniref:DUF3558 domain-containing protein n=1 Tax=Actinophytocola sp. TaxID=1872138 RepID=UPI002ED03CD4
MTTGRRAWLATVLSAALLAACDSKAPPPPIPGTSTTTSTDPAQQAPKVTHPLDDKEFLADPCRSLTTPQLTALGLTEPLKNRGDDSFESKVGCGYRVPDPETDLLAYVNYYPETTTGLDEVYADRPPTPSPTWTATVIDGYPAVTIAPGDDRTRCHVNVGTSDDTYFEITYYYFDWNDWDGRDTCAAATSIAAAVLANMKAAN